MSKLLRIEKKLDRILNLLGEEETVNMQQPKGSIRGTTHIGELSHSNLKRFNLGPYSKTSTPGCGWEYDYIKGK